MLAQGIGITPFRSMLRQLARRGMDKNTTLVHVGRYHAFRSDTEVIVKQAHYPTLPEVFGRQLEAAAVQQPDATFMVSGGSGFVKSTVAS